MSGDRGSNDAPEDGAPEDGAPEDRDHLGDLPDGAGCAEIWSHLSERREAGAQAGVQADD